MKTSETKTTAAQPAQSSAQTLGPFFKQDGQGSFFSETAQAETPFFSPDTVQTKLTIGQPGDKYEQEADATAEKVVQRLEAPSTSPKGGEGLQRAGSGTPGEEDLLRKEEEPEVQEKIQRKPIFDSADEAPDEGDGGNSAIQRQEAGADPVSTPGNLSAQLNSHRGGGTPLPEDTRTQMESAFGTDFSTVRVHTGNEAGKMSESINAQAFTQGSDIYFNAGKYNTGSTEGKKLLAHELTHTVQQGATVRPKLKIYSGHAPSIQRGWDLGNFIKSGINKIGNAINEGLDWVKNKIKEGLSWAAQSLIPGFSLLNVILGKDLITDEPVERSGINLVRAYMQLIPVIGTVLFNELEETETLPQAAVWTEEQVAKFGINFDDIAQRLKMMWDELSATAGMDYNIQIVKKYIGPVLGKFLAFSGVMEDKMKELRLEGALRLVGATELLTALKNDPAAFKRVADDPTLILSNFMEALKKGFTKFSDNFSTHFENALLGWLFGKSAEMGIQMPKDLSLGGLFYLVAQLVGVTFDQIKSLVIKQLGPTGQRVFEEIEASIPVVQRVLTEGPIALWEMVKEYLTDLKEMLFSQITQLVTTEIIKAAVTKLVSMLNPAGAIVQLALTLYRVIKFFIDNWETIKSIANGIINSITKVALGQLDEAADFVEGILGKGMQLIISFLANIFGLSGIVDKVKGVIKKITAPVIKARDKAIKWLVKKGKALFNKIFGKGDKGKKAGKDDNEKAGSLAPVDQEIENLGKEEKKDGEITKEEADQIAGRVKKDQGALIGNISVKDGGETWDFDYVQRAKKVRKTSALPQTSEPVYGGLYHGFGTSMNIETLTKNRNAGTSANKAPQNDNWDILQLRGVWKSTYYVRGHLLSEKLSGLAEWKNLTPLTRRANTELHEPIVEKPIKDATKRGEIVSYSVDVNYGRPSNQDKINAVKKSKDFSKQEKEATILILKAEEHVPTGLVCNAVSKIEKPDGTFDEKVIVPNIEIPNEIDSYVYFDEAGNPLTD
ncbi:MAG: DUF4157 domain-containing protein [Saprospirales bacterium]|nr:DUF4157 domain-containing protein [Saprospirales bacterium]